MKRVLIVKVTSLGDIVEALPVVADIKRAYPGVEVDWAADEAFAEVVHWSQSVDRVLCAPLRRFKKARSWGETIVKTSSARLRTASSTIAAGHLRRSAQHSESPKRKPLISLHLMGLFLRFRIFRARHFQNERWRLSVEAPYRDDSTISTADESSIAQWRVPALLASLAHHEMAERVRAGKFPRLRPQ